MPQTLDERVENAGKFNDNTFYLQFLHYFDLLGQVHSVVETRRGTYVLRVWRAQRFGPEKYLKQREANLWRVSEESFGRYIVAPEPRIAKAIEVYGKELLMEIEVYDEHREALETLMSGDFVAITNVHYARDPRSESLRVHKGTCYNRGISRVPENHHDANFRDLKEKVERCLENIDDYGTHVEFMKSTPTRSPVPQQPKPLHRQNPEEVPVEDGLAHYLMDEETMGTTVETMAQQGINAVVPKYENVATCEEDSFDGVDQKQDDTEGQHELEDVVIAEEPEVVLSETSGEESEEEEVLERNLDLWSEGPPKTLKEAIARLQQKPPAKRRKRAQ